MIIANYGRYHIFYNWGLESRIWEKFVLISIFRHILWYLRFDFGVEETILIKKSFENSDLVFISNIISRKFVMVDTKGILDLREEIILLGR